MHERASRPRRLADRGLFNPINMNQDQTLAVRERDGVIDYDRHMQMAKRGQIVLRLPRKIGYAGALGRSVSLVQLIATWANANSERSIRTTLAIDDQDNIERFSSRLHGLAAAYYAKQITGVDGQTDLRRALLDAATPRFRAMSERQYANTAKGRLTQLIFLHRAKRQFHSAVYLREPTPPDIMDPQSHGKRVVSAREMNELLFNALRAHRLPPRDLKRIAPLLNSRGTPLGTLLHETFRNTAEHAYLDIEGRVPARGLRCILIAARNVHPDKLHPQSFVSAEHPDLDSYFARLRDHAIPRRRSLVHILELSVLDTGPGFAATIAGQVDAESGDADRVAQCFNDHVSSKRGPNSGLGLGHVLSHIGALGGFLRIRTSSTEAFFSSPSHISDNNPAPHVAGDLPEATGTALTMAVPLEA